MRCDIASRRDASFVGRNSRFALDIVRAVWNNRRVAPVGRGRVRGRQQHFVSATAQSIQTPSLDLLAHMSDAAELRDLGQHALRDGDGALLAEALDALYAISASTQLEDALEAALPGLDIARRRALAPALARSGRLATARVFVEQLAGHDDLVAHAVLAPTHGPMDRALVERLDADIAHPGAGRWLDALGRRRSQIALDWLLTRGRQVSTESASTESASTEPASTAPDSTAPDTARPDSGASADVPGTDAPDCSPAEASDERRAISTRLALALAHFDDDDAWRTLRQAVRRCALDGFDRRTLEARLIADGARRRVFEHFAPRVERALGAGDAVTNDAAAAGEFAANGAARRTVTATNVGAPAASSAHADVRDATTVLRAVATAAEQPGRVDERWWPLAWRAWRDESLHHAELSHAALAVVTGIDHPDKAALVMPMAVRGEAPAALVASLDRLPERTTVWTGIARSSPRAFDVAAAAEKLAATGDETHVTTALAALERTLDTSAPWVLQRQLEACRQVPDAACARLVDKACHELDRTPTVAPAVSELLAFEAAHAGERSGGVLPGLDRLRDTLLQCTDEAIDDALLAVVAATAAGERAVATAHHCEILAARRRTTAARFRAATSHLSDGPVGDAVARGLETLRTAP